MISTIATRYAGLAENADKKGPWAFFFRASEDGRGRSGTQPLRRYQIYSGLEAVKRVGGLARL